MTRENTLAAVVTELTRTLVDEFDVLGFLQSVAERTSEMFGGATAALFLADQRGSLQLVGLSPRGSDPSDVLQVALRPALHVYRSGRPVVASLGGEGRWRDAAGAALDLGLRSVEAVPLLIRDDCLGVLLFLGADEPSDTESSDTEGAAEALRALGGIATVGLLQQRSPRQRELMAEQVQAALALRVVVEQATGMIAEVAQVSIPDAFSMLEQHARASGRALGEAAQQVVADRGRLVGPAAGGDGGASRPASSPPSTAGPS